MMLVEVCQGLSCCVYLMRSKLSRRISKRLAFYASLMSTGNYESFGTEDQDSSSYVMSGKESFDI